MNKKEKASMWRRAAAVIDTHAVVVEWDDTVAKYLRDIIAPSLRRRAEIIERRRTHNPGTI